MGMSKAPRIVEALADRLRTLDFLVLRTQRRDTTAGRDSMFKAEVYLIVRSSVVLAVNV